MRQVTRIALVGCPNVGKSVLFNYLTGTYVTVSNYPGTTIDIAKGKFRYRGSTYEIVDTPGMYSLVPFTDEERVTRQFLEQEPVDLVIHVVDAKNISRMLPLTLQLIEAGLPVILVINLIDEAADKGIYIQTKKLSVLLGIPVVSTSATKKIGLEELKQSIASYRHEKPNAFNYSQLVETNIKELIAAIPTDQGFSARAIVLLLLQGDSHTLAAARSYPNADMLFSSLYRCLERMGDCPELMIHTQRRELVETLLKIVVRRRLRHKKTLTETAGQISREPLLGIPILMLVLYAGLYQFVGHFGAGFLVDYLDKVIFAQHITPLVERTVLLNIPWEWARSLLIGDYGIYSLGFRYAVVIVLPIVGTFFLMFAVLEDCGYLPRLAMLVDKLFRLIGLNGRAVIPVTLGFGCGTMAVMVTRTLETKRERLLATFLLALAIPCSAQLGVVLALLSHHVFLLTIWVLFIGMVSLTAGLLGARLLPGTRSPFYMELPPIRMPVLTNIVKKAYSRMMVYFYEILPIFVLTSFLLWVSERFGLLARIVAAMIPLMDLLGLPGDAADIFLLGFFRRDYGAAGLYDMARQGLLGERELLVACTTLTLFMPCVAQLTVMVKERGMLASMIIVVLIMTIAFGSGLLLNRFLHFIL